MERSNNTSLTDEEENGVRFQLLLCLATKTLRDYFHQYLPSSPDELHTVLKKEENYVKLSHLRSKKVLTHPQWQLLFPKTCLTDSRQFDITLLFVLLSEICGILPPLKGWFQNPSPSDVAEAADIIRIKAIRDEQKHRPGLGLCKSKYEKLWTDLSSPLLNLHCLQADIDNIRRKHLDTILLKKYQVSTEANLRLQFSNQTLEDEKKKLQDAICNGISFGMLPNVSSHVTRDDDIENVHKGLEEMDESKIAFVITGLGGVGKTVLARHYSHSKVQKFYDNNVIWLNAETSATLRASIQNVAQVIQVSDYNKEQIESSVLLQRVYNFFGNRKSLFVFDNANDYNVVEEFLKVSVPNMSVKPTILITSQFTRWGEHFVQYTLDVFTMDTAKKFIQGKLTEEYHCLDDRNCRKVCQFVDCLPLALEQCVSYIIQNNMQVDDYIELFRKYNTELLSVPSDDLTYQKTVLTTWKMALGKLHGNKTSVAISMMIHLSYLDGKNVNKQLLLPLFDSNVIEVDKAIKELCAYSLVTSYHQGNSTILTIHSLVQKSIQLEVLQTGGYDIESYVCYFFKSIFTTHNANVLHVDYGNLWRHHLLHIVDMFKSNEKVIYELLKYLDKLQPAFYNTLQMSELLSMLDIICEALEEFHDVNDAVVVDLLKQREDARIVFERLSDFKAAVNAMSRRKIPRENPIGLSIDELGHDFTSPYLREAVLKFKNDDLNEALESFQKAEAYESIDDRVYIQFWIARCLNCLGRSDEALDLFTKIHPLFKKRCGADHYFVLVCEMAEVFCMLQQGLHSDAANISRMNLSRFEGKYGPDHAVILHINVFVRYVKDMNLLMEETGNCMFSGRQIDTFEKMIEYFRIFEKSCPELKRIISNLEKDVMIQTALQEYTLV